MKYPGHLFLLSFFLFLACSSEDTDDGRVIDGEPAASYSSTFVEELPTNSYIEDTYLEEIWKFMETVVPYSSVFGKRTTESNEAHHYSLTYKLLLASRSAKLEIDTLVYSKVVTKEYDVETRRYREGRYIAGENEYSDLVFDVDERTIYYGYVLKGTGEPTQSYRKLADLENGGRSIYTLTDERSADLPPTASSYSGVFSAIVEPTGMVTLKNGDLTFNFHPATGLLTQVEPVYKEIGRLDKE